MKTDIKNFYISPMSDIFEFIGEGTVCVTSEQDGGVGFGGNFFGWN